MSAVAEIVPTTQEDSLSSGWTLATIADLVGDGGVFVDGDWVESKDQDPEGDVRLIQLADIGDGEYRDKSARFLTHAKAVELGCTFLKKGDVLIARMPDPLGRACIFPGDSKPAVTVVDVAIVRSSAAGEFDHRWLMYFVNAPAFRSAVASMQSGSTRKRISRGNLAKIALPVPPLDQQKRIVAEIEKQFSRLNEAVANLKRVKANLKRYKAAVLKAAVEGRLVETEAELARREGRSLPTPRPGVFYVYAIRCNDDSIYIGHTDDLARRWEEHLAGQAADWTRQHKPMQIVHYEEYSSRQEASDREKWLKTGYGRKWIKREIEAGRARQVGFETGEQLLQRILETRRSQWQGKGKYKEPAAPDTSDLPELPEGWVWATLGSLGYVIGGLTKNPKRATLKKKLPYLRVANVYANELRLDEIEEIGVDDSELEKLLVHKGDLLIVEGNGSPDQIGRLAIWDGSISPCVHQNHLIKVRLQGECAPEWVMSWLMSPDGRNHVRDVASSTSGLYTLSVGKVSDLPIPLPPVNEQHRIVAEVDRRLSLLRETEAQVDTNLQRAERLRQSILSRAFSAGDAISHRVAP